MGNDLILFGIYIFLIIASLGFHEFGHAWVASLRGDDTAKDLGRVTLNPIAHIDPILTVVVPILATIMFKFPFGGAKPVPVTVQNLKNPRWDNLWVTLAGPAANLVLAVVFAIVLVAVFGSDVLAGSSVPWQERYLALSENPLFNVLCGLVLMNIFLALFNLMPVPPLDGSHILGTFLPADVAFAYQRIGWMGFAMLLIALSAGGMQYLLQPVFFVIQALQLELEIIWNGMLAVHSIPGRYF